MFSRRPWARHETGVAKTHAFAHQGIPTGTPAPEAPERGTRRGDLENPIEARGPPLIATSGPVARQRAGLSGALTATTSAREVSPEAADHSAVWAALSLGHRSAGRSTDPYSSHEPVPLARWRAVDGTATGACTPSDPSYPSPKSRAAYDRSGAWCEQSPVSTADGTIARWRTFTAGESEHRELPHAGANSTAQM